MILGQQKVECLLRVGDEILPQVEKFKYLGVLFMSERKMKREIDRQKRTVMRTLSRCGEEGAEPNSNAHNLLVDICSYPHLWSWALGNYQNNDITGKSNWNEFPS